jgi:arylsulfatase
MRLQIWIFDLNQIRSACAQTIVNVLLAPNMNWVLGDTNRLTTCNRRNNHEGTKIIARVTLWCRRRDPGEFTNICPTAKKTKYRHADDRRHRLERFRGLWGGANLGHPTPNIDRIAQEGAVFTSWYGQASCTAGRASFMTGRIPIRSALSIVIAPGDENGLMKSTPTIAEFFQKSGYSTYFSGKWHLGDQPKFYPIEHGFDEMKEFAAYYPGVYTYDDTDNFAHPWFPKFNAAYWDEYQKIVNLNEWEGTAGKPATKVARIDYEYLHEFDVRQADSAVAYIKQHAKDAKPFFMDVNFMKMHNPNIPSKAFIGKSHLGNYSDAMLELDSNIGKIIDEIRAEAPNTIVIITADNGAWQDAWPDAGTVPFRGEKGSPFERGFRVPGIMWWPGHIPAGAHYGEMMSHIDCWATLATMVGLTPPPPRCVDGQRQQADLFRQH